MELADIYREIEEDLASVRRALVSISDVDYPWLAEQLSYVVRVGGKSIRPALTLLSGRFHDYDMKYLLPMAVSVELMHTATLIHDDAIDEALTRRGQPTINRLFGDDIAILLGDYLFAKAGEFVSDTQTPRVIKLFSQTLGIISRGEINQFLNAFRIDQAREEYFRRIYGKTASLFALATESGAILSHAGEEAITILKRYGEDLGIAFQVVDDILDFISTEEDLGKPVGSDLLQGTMTLPAMMVLERYPGDNPVRRVLEDRDESHVTPAIDMVRSSGVVEECYRVAGEYADKACRDLDRLPDSTARDALCNLAGYVVQRKI